MRHIESEGPVKPMRQPEWRALLYRNTDFEDKIAVRNLQVTVDAGKDAWGREKVQPALLTVTLSLSNSFDSAAAADALDNSTIHYGHLSKTIKSTVENFLGHLTSHGLVAHTVSSIFKVADEKTDLHAYEVEVLYPKGSLLGDGVAWYYGELEVPRHGRFCTRTLHIRNLRIPCLIGINSNEREHTQPVVVNVWLEDVAPHLCDEGHHIESIVVDEIVGSSFETLEALADNVVRGLRDDYFKSDPQYNDVFIRVRVEKPLAVPFADAPSIEIVRPIRTGPRTGRMVHE